MKKFLSLFLSLAMVFAILPAGLFTLPAKATTSGDYTYSVGGGKATITDISESISGDVVIPSTLGGYPVTSIGNRAFYKCASLTSITIPDSVTSIEDYAFSDCTSLTSATIGNGLTWIGDGAFYKCTSLTSITIPDSVTSIEDYAFYNCKNLTSITIPNSVTRIGDYAFYYCTSLQIVYYPCNKDIDSISIGSYNSYLTKTQRVSQHSFKAEAITNPTCTEQGYTTYTCDYCGDTFDSDYVDALGHDFVAGEVVAPQIGVRGYTVYECSFGCGTTEHRDFTPALPEVPTDRVNNVAVVPSDIGVTLTWDAFAGVNEYYAKIYDKDFTKCLKTITTTETSAFFDYKLLAYNTEYKFIVTAKYNTNKYLTVANATKVDGAMEIANRVVGHTVKMEGVGAVVDFLPVSGAQEYMVNVFENDANGTRIYNASLGTATSARVMTNLTAGTTYVVMINVKLAGKWTALADLRVNGIGVSFIAPVYNPSNVTIADQTANSIRFNWSNVRGATQYFIRVTEKETGALINTLKAEGKTTATLSRGTDGQRLKANTTYLIQFYTYVNSVTNSGVYGDPIEVTTIDYEDITVTAAENAGKLTATWNKTTNAVGYFVRTYKDGVQIGNKYVDGADKTSYSIKVPTEAGAYSFGIIAYEKNTSGAAYTPVSISNEVAIG